MTAAQVAGTDDVSLAAGNNLTISAGTNTSQSYQYHNESTSGLFSGGSFGVTLGSKEMSQQLKQTGQSITASTIGSIQGNVTLTAGSHYSQTGSDVLTPAGNISITAQSVTLDEARQQSSLESETRSKQTGLTLAITNPVLNAIQTAEQMKQASSKTSDGRMQALAAASTAMAGMGAAKAVMDPKTQGQLGGVNLTLSLGSSHSESRSTQHSDTAAGSTLMAGGDISIQATGAGTASNLIIQGGTVKANGTISLQADNQIQLTAAQNTSEQHSTNKSSSGSIGVSYGTDGLAFSVSASKGKGYTDGTDLSYSNTHVEAGKTLTLQSGGDTTLKGAVATGEQIQANIGGNLTLQSQQDISRYDGHQQSSGMSLSGGFSATAWGGSVSHSEQKVSNDYLSVAEQSGLKARDGGFQLNVSGQTSLTGAVISSSETAVAQGINQLHTSGLSLSDLDNHANYSASGYSVSAGVSEGKPTGSMGAGSSSGSASSVSRSGVSGLAGNSDVRTGDAETGLKNTFNAQKVTDDVGAQIAITQEFGKQASKTWADYATTKEAEALKAGDREEAAKWGEGGSYRVAGHVALGAVSGGTAGATGALVSAEVMPTVGAALEQTDLPTAVKQALGMVASSALGAATGMGVAGVAAAYNVDTNNRQLHSVERQAIEKYKGSFAKKLSEELGRPVSSDEAEKWLAEAAYANVDQGAQNAIQTILPGNAASDERVAYNAAKIYLFQIQQQEGNKSLFVELNPAIRQNQFIGKNVNDSSYREFVWKNFGINEKPSNPTAKELAVYQQREELLLENKVKQLVVMTVASAMPGAVNLGRSMRTAEKPVQSSANSGTPSLADEANATLPMGSKVNQMNQPKNPSYQPVRNNPATVDGTDYAGHALDRMQDRGITPSVVQNTINVGVPTASRGGTTVYYDSVNNVSVVVNAAGKVVTVKYGK